ncbi:unannotated protein [freshwater metagenome]|uniref:Unannotated protein n=1 Tax=freshwater metagenome TaxID=449393 RepID=A0A6J7DRX6_9ZZZZ|nr:DUF952 domain-containing protein [Actinomycetota bacterium]
MSIILHLIPAADWQRFAPDDPVTNASLFTEGFIHCTADAAMLLQVANAFYTSHDGDFVALHIDTSLLTSECIWEAPAHLNAAPPAADASRRNAPPLPSAPLFPHVYGPINRRAVVGLDHVERDASGRFVGYSPGDAIA